MFDLTLPEFLNYLSWYIYIASFFLFLNAFTSGFKNREFTITDVKEAFLWFIYFTKDLGILFKFIYELKRKDNNGRNK